MGNVNESKQFNQKNQPINPTSSKLNSDLNIVQQLLFVKNVETGEYLPFENLNTNKTSSKNRDLVWEIYLKNKETEEKQSQYLKILNQK
ncbi:hypothetical protein M0811_01166 [Anaeramoeba ignava]|uniref:Uncharacterized protein n=1 Tax=Anaeramoeba ignava TaxID=1746090 RepID=A0A9Q0LMK3_ANAIG|nr:hypothetical protein M0811_01166 [Anaeramoeba ignava]